MSDFSYKLINKKSGRDSLVDDGIIVNFLYKQLEQHGDSIDAINKAIDYIFNEKGGFILVQFKGNEITGICLVNETGMAGYIPENILVYIAINKDNRGEGLGKELMQNAIKICNGDVALHVEKNNPARFLYEKLGFTNPYLEMRLKRN